MRFEIATESRIGRRRSNQDRLVWRESAESLLLMVADGMGGHAHGELAARIATDLVAQRFSLIATPRLPDPYLFLARALSDAHAALAAEASRRSLPEIPLTTCVVCVIQDGIACWAHAGDSRLYLLRGGRVHARTHDHSHVQQLIEQGVISVAESLHHPARHRVFSCLGGAAPPQVDFSRKYPLQQGDILLLCTDGLWAALPEAELAGLAATLGTTSLARALPAAMIRAEACSGPDCDNLSAIALRWQDGPAPDGPGGSIFSDEDIERAIDEIRGIIRSSKN
ncbi:MAG: serine/threonine-protein phosphatase [Proteobacteria bacterium]|nr:serine/threonine-protein phosphatase [Pseudomonadota bacterium]HQR04794.1 protein phosphatase 2C domain-containing protein [Rhodocyclaceae bacterium]